jgi:glycosyltransferase involved in cell wall biosynthesis
MSFTLGEIMRILMVVPKYPFPVMGGLERQAHELAKALVARGHSVHALSSSFDAVHAAFKYLDGVAVHRIAWRENRAVRFMVFPFSLSRALYKLKREVDVVHVHNISPYGAFVTFLVKVLGLPVMVKLPNIGDYGIPAMQSAPLGYLRVALLKLADVIIAMTPESMAELGSIGFPAARILKVTNGIPMLATDLPVQRPGRLDMLTAVFVGRLSPEKGLPNLVAAWGKVKARATRPVRLRLIGDGPQEGELRALTLALKLDDSVEFCGFCANVPAELVKADLFVLSSYVEGNSNAILEAMRAALPIVATRVGGAPIQVGQEGERFLVPVDDRDALAKRLLELIEDEPLRMRTGAAMRSRVEGVFAIDRIAAVYEQAYELLLAGHRERVGQINPSLFSSHECGSSQCTQ